MLKCVVSKCSKNSGKLRREDVSGHLLFVPFLWEGNELLTHLACCKWLSTFAGTLVFRPLPMCRLRAQNIAVMNEMVRIQSSDFCLLEAKEQDSQISNFLCFFFFFPLRISHYSQGPIRKYMLRAKQECLTAYGEMHQNG